MSDETKPSEPATAEATLAALVAAFDELSPQLQRAARFILDNPREVGVRSMRSLAGLAEVHPNTLVRLAQAIHFDGFETLRDRFRHFVVADTFGGYRDRAAWLKELDAKGGSSELIAKMADATGDNLQAMWQRQHPDTLNRVADAIITAPRVFVLGMGSAYSLAHQFWYVARMAFDTIAPIPRHGSHPIDDLAWVNSDDVLIALTFQPYRAETLAAARLAKSRGATLIGVTDSPTSPLARISDDVLISPTHTPQFFESHAAVTALLEGLLAVTVARAGDDAAERIARFHAQRLDAGLYEEPDALARLG